jgi:HTH-type transcriptional regulator / antitoxin HipB
MALKRYLTFITVELYSLNITLELYRAMDHPIQTPTQLSAHLKSLRQSKGMSQAELGRLLGVGQVRIANIEKDPGAISVDQLIRILHLLDARLVLQPNSPQSRAQSGTTVEW